MFSIFGSRRDASTLVVAGEHDFWMQHKRMCPYRALSDAQGDVHGDIDLRLAQKIEELLVPELGAWENSDAWFHQMDFYGDGVRSLAFRRDVFPRSRLAQLQALLVGEHEPFSILCTVTDRMTGSSEVPAREDDYLAIFSTRMLITRPLADELSIAG